MQARVQVLESLPPTPLVVEVMVDAVPGPVDQAVAADLNLLHQAVNPDSGIHRFSLPFPFRTTP